MVPENQFVPTRPLEYNQLDLLPACEWDWESVTFELVSSVTILHFAVDVDEL